MTLRGKLIGPGWGNQHLSQPQSSLPCVPVPVAASLHAPHASACVRAMDIGCPRDQSRKRDLKRDCDRGCPWDRDRELYVLPPARILASLRPADPSGVGASQSTLAPVWGLFLIGTTILLPLNGPLRTASGTTVSSHCHGSLAIDARAELTVSALILPHLAFMIAMLVVCGQVGPRRRARRPSLVSPSPSCRSV